MLWVNHWNCRNLRNIFLGDHSHRAEQLANRSWTLALSRIKSTNPRIFCNFAWHQVSLIYYQYWKYRCVVRFVYFVWHEGEKRAKRFSSYIAGVVYNLFHFQIKHFSPILPVLCLIVPDIRFLPHICYTILQQEPRQKIFLNTFCIPWVSLNVMPGMCYYLKLEILWLLKVGWFVLSAIIRYQTNIKVCLYCLH